MAKKPWNECLEACLKTSPRINTDAIVWMEVAKKRKVFLERKRMGAQVLSVEGRFAKKKRKRCHLRHCEIFALQVHRRKVWTPQGREKMVLSINFLVKKIILRPT